jgi:hypothetical protein
VATLPGATRKGECDVSRSKRVVCSGNAAPASATKRVGRAARIARSAEHRRYVRGWKPHACAALLHVSAPGRPGRGHERADVDAERSARAPSGRPRRRRALPCCGRRGRRGVRRLRSGRRAARRRSRASRRRAGSARSRTRPRRTAGRALAGSVAASPWPSLSTAMAARPVAASSAVTDAQHQPPCHAPCRSTIGADEGCSFRRADHR